MTARAGHEVDEMASHIVVEDGETSRTQREERERGFEACVRELVAIGQCCAGQLRDGPSAIEHGDFLYDEHGLPK